MRVKKLSDTYRGWLVGDFYPSLVSTREVEVAVKFYKQGDVEPKHVHYRSTEYTIIISGKVKMNDIEFFEGDIVTVSPNEWVRFEAITDAKTVCIKTPSCPDDKYVEGQL